MTHVHPTEIERLPVQDRPVRFDDCDECNARADSPLDGLCHLDEAHFTALWNRMLAAEYGRSGYSGYLSFNDKKAGHALYLMTILMQRWPFITEGG